MKILSFYITLLAKFVFVDYVFVSSVLTNFLIKTDLNADRYIIFGSNQG